MSPASGAAETADTTPKGKPTWSGLTSGQKILIVAGVIVSALILFGILVGSDDEDGGSASGDRDLDAYDVCKQFVEDRLKAPGTADFPSLSGNDVEISNISDRYTATAHVDAENAFGAKLRLPFVCTVEYLSGTEWRLVNFELTE